MPLRKRTKKRLAFLVAIVVVLGVLVGSAYFIRERQINSRALAARDDGMAAYSEGSYEEAFEGLLTYFGRYRQEASPEELYAFAESRLNVPLPNNRHIAEAINILQFAVDQDPNNTKATNLLLSLRLQVGQTLESIKLANSILSKEPESKIALESLIFAHRIAGDRDEAIKVAKQYQLLRPDEVGVARMLISMMLQSPTHRIELVGEQGMLASLRAEHAEHPGFQLLLAQAYRSLEKSELAAECLTAAVDAPFVDVRTAKDIASEMMRDRTRGFEAAFSYINHFVQTVEGDEIDELKLWLAQQRLFLGQPEQAAQLASAIDPESDFYVDALGLSALAGNDLGQDEKVKEVANKLGGLDSEDAAAWKHVIDKLMLGNGATATQIRPVLLDAIKASPNSIYFRYALALIYRDLGEPELAASYLVPVVQSEPAWWGAALELSSLFESSKAIGSAFRVIDQVYRLHPNVNAVRLRWAVLRTALLPKGDPETARETLERIDTFKAEVEKQFPKAVDTLALARARCLGILDRKQALQALLTDLVKNADNAQIRTIAAEFGRRFKVDLDVQPQTTEAKGNELIQEALGRADILVANKKPDEALALVKQALEASELSEAQRERAMLAFMDNHGLPEALPLWKKLIEQSGENANLLRAAAASQLVLADKTLGPIVTEKLKSLTGQEGYAWRMAELKRKALNSKSNAERAELADELSRIIRSGYNKADARQLLSSILMDMGNTRGALNQLSLSVEENPYHAESNLALIRLALLEQRYPVAKAALSRLTQIENIKPVVLAEIARVADRLGERDIANALRDRPEVAPYLRPRENLVRLQDALIAQRPKEVQSLTQELIASSDPALLRQLSIVLALYSGIDAAQPALQALSENSQSDPVILARTHASIKEITGDPKAALDILSSAVEQGLAKEDRALWSQYLRLLLSQPDGLDNAVKALREDSSTDADKAARYCFEHALTKKDQRKSILASLGLEALQSKSPGIFQQAAKLIHEDSWQSQRDGAVGGAQSGPSAKVLAELEALRAANPDQISLYNLLTSLYIVEQQFAKAITLAQRTQDEFPEDAVSARLLTQAYAETNQWRLVLGAAKTWRAVATPTRETLETIDLLTATALIETGDPNTALNTLRGYASDRAIAITARSMIKGGRIADAEEILFPLMRTDSPRWRVTAMQLAVTDVLEASPERAGKWLSELKPIIPADAVGERLLWAQTSFVVGQRAKDEVRQQQAFGMVKSMSSKPNFPANGWLLIGVYHDSKDEDDQAKLAYEKALQLDPNQHQAANNLANILMKRNEFGRARKLIGQAMAMTANNPRASYIDTLAQIEKRQGNIDKAIELFTEVIRLEPENPIWYIDQAELLVQAERRDEARELLRRMKRWVPKIDEDEKELIERHNKLEKTLGS